jgi:ABC-type dipeptide/oligopeptide/nickel transport system ATPase component
MKYLFIIGASGSGKTSLGKKLMDIYPDQFQRIVQNTTRAKRPNEVEELDYHFLTDEQYDQYIKTNALTAAVEYEFLPVRYGTLIRELDENKINVIAVSLEGLMDGVNKLKATDKARMLLISNVEQPDVVRDNRSFVDENKYNTIVARKLSAMLAFEGVQLVEIDHLELKKIRNDQEKMKEFILEKLSF